MGSGCDLDEKSCGFLFVAAILECVHSRGEEL